MRAARRRRVFAAARRGGAGGEAGGCGPARRGGARERGAAPRSARPGGQTRCPAPQRAPALGCSTGASAVSGESFGRGSRDPALRGSEPGPGPRLGPTPSRAPVRPRCPRFQSPAARGTAGAGRPPAVCERRARDSRLLLL